MLKLHFTKSINSEFVQRSHQMTGLRKGLQKVAVSQSSSCTNDGFGQTHH